MSTETQILCCTNCGGKGYKELEELTDYHNNIYTRWKTECSVCKSTGLILKTTTVETTVEPYFVPKKDLRPNNWRPD